MKVPTEGTLLFVGLLAFAGCAAALSGVPLPPDVAIVAPAPEVPKDLVGFSGKWSGTWDGILDHVLIVEEINPPRAQTIYAWGTAAQWNIREGSFARVRGEFVEGGLKLTLPGRTAFYRLQPDGTLEGTYSIEARGLVSRAVMTRTPDEPHRTPRLVGLSPTDQEVAGRLKGEWGGTWQADNGSRGRFELKIASVDGATVRGEGTWYNTVVGTAPFLFSGELKDEGLWISRGPNSWFRLKLYESGAGTHNLRGRYSTVGRGTVYEGDIIVTKRK